MFKTNEPKQTGANQRIENINRGRKEHEIKNGIGSNNGERKVNSLGQSMVFCLRKNEVKNTNTTRQSAKEQKKMKNECYEKLNHERQFSLYTFKVRI